MDACELTQRLQQRLRFSKRIRSAHAAVLIAITDEADPESIADAPFSLFE